MTHRRPPRLADACYLGAQRVFLTMCTFKRRPHFLEDARVRLVREQLLLDATSIDIEVIAYCFMPDHLHALIEGKSERADAKSWADAFRRRSGYHYRRLDGSRLWQDGHVDHVLRDEDGTLSVVSYIMANPVEAGLCADVREYPYSGSSRYTLEDLAAAVQWRP